MNKQFLQILLLIITLTFQTALAEETFDVNEKADNYYNKAQRLYSQQKYKEAIKWYEESYKYKPSGDAANNLGTANSELKNFNEAIQWYKKAYKHGVKISAKNLALVYDEELKDYPNAIEWYEKASDNGINSAAFNLALLYEDKKNDIPSAIKWYKRAIILEYKDAYDNISLIYHDKKDDLTASAYYIATIDKSYTKKQIIDFLKNDWKIDDETLKKAYKLQLTLVPNPYKGGID